MKKLIIITTEVSLKSAALDLSINNVKPTIINPCEFNAAECLGRVEKAIVGNGSEFDLLLGVQGQTNSEPIVVLRQACELVKKASNSMDWKTNMFESLI